MPLGFARQLFANASLQSHETRPATTMSLACLTANYINWDNKPAHQRARIHLLRERCCGGRISFAGGKWQGHWHYDAATRQLVGAFNARGHGAPLHGFGVSLCPNRQFGTGTDYAGRRIYLANLRWIHWQPACGCWGLPKSLAAPTVAAPAAIEAADDIWEMVD